MKLYKFRAIDSRESADRVEQVLQSGEFWCSRFWEMNDPMEGVYRLNPDAVNSDIEGTFAIKAKQLICCFSAKEALYKPHMWGYYANGFKGVAIEIDVDPAQVHKEGNRLEKMSYFDEVKCADIGNNTDESVKNILCRKLKAWEHECEYRFITDGDTNKQLVGKITGLIVGYSYPKTAARLTGNMRWEKAADYLCRVRRLIETATSIGVSLRRAQMKNAAVELKETDAASLRLLL